MICLVAGLVGAVCFLIVYYISQDTDRSVKKILKAMNEANRGNLDSNCLLYTSYSNLPGNIMGQICPQYCLLWLPVSLAGIVLDDWLRYWWWGEDLPHYKLY